MKLDVAIIGGGPAGISAAIEIAKRGGKVSVLDENRSFGGKLLGQLHEDPQKQHWWKGAEIAQKLVKEAEDAGVILQNQVQVWALEQGWTVNYADVLNRPLPTNRVDAKAVLLATGATEKPLPLPGWTLPGVMTIGAAQVLTNVYRVKPGKRVLVVGVDVLSLTIARAMDIAGVDVLGIYLPGKNVCTEEKSNPKRVLSYLQTMTHLAPNPLLRIGGTLLKHDAGVKLVSKFYPSSGLKVWGLPIHLRKALVSVVGETEVTGAEICEIDTDGNPILGSSTTVDADAVLLSGGLSPLTELAAIAGCKYVNINGLGGPVPLHSRYLETTMENLFIAGNITGIEGAKIAMLQGELAAKKICQNLGIGSISQQELHTSYQKLSLARLESEFQFELKVVQARERLNKFWDEYQLS